MSTFFVKFSLQMLLPLKVRPSCSILQKRHALVNKHYYCWEFWSLVVASSVLKISVFLQQTFSLVQLKITDFASNLAFSSLRLCYIKTTVLFGDPNLCVA